MGLAKGALRSAFCFLAGLLAMSPRANGVDEGCCLAALTGGKPPAVARDFAQVGAPFSAALLIGFLACGTAMGPEAAI